MYQLLKKRKESIRIIAGYTVMTLSVITIATFAAFFMMGYRFNIADGKIEQYAFIQFASSPSGAIVTVDGYNINSKTPNKGTFHAGKHDITISRDGYDTWSKSVDIKAGTITWLNYALLIPNKLDVEAMTTYSTVYSSLTAPESRSMLIQKQADIPTFNLVDLTADSFKSSTFTIPAKIYSDAYTTGVSHSFNMIKWDEAGRYVLVDHTYGAKNEWLVMDTQDVSQTKNISRTFNIAISNISFAGTSGNNFFVLDSTDIRKLDLLAGTMSKPLVSQVSSFSVYKSNIIAYVGTDTTGTSNQVVGIYREGDTSLHVLRIASTADSNLNIATSHYFNQDYIAISDGKTVDVLSGSYPNTVEENTTSMKLMSSFYTSEDVRSLSFSPIGEYVLMQSGGYYASYNLEYQTFTESTIDGVGDSYQLKWLDDSYLWTDRGGNLVIGEFDGANKHTINAVAVGQDVALTHDAKYLYSINKIDTGYQLQRVRMILP